MFLLARRKKTDGRNAVAGVVTYSGEAQYARLHGATVTASTGHDPPTQPGEKVAPGSCLNLVRPVPVSSGILAGVFPQEGYP